MDLAEQHSATLGVVVPIERHHRFNNKQQTVAVAMSAAIPGFAFVPVGNAAQLRRVAPLSHNLRQLFTPTGFPCTVTNRELDGLQERLNREYGGEYTFAIGNKVLVHFHPLNPAGVEGEIVKFRSTGKARIKLNKLKSFVEVPQLLLSKV